MAELTAAAARDLADAPAQDVVITETLDASLDPSTFTFGSFAFGSLTVDVPAGLQQYHTQVAYQNPTPAARAYSRRIVMVI